MALNRLADTLCAWLRSGGVFVADTGSNSGASIASTNVSRTETRLEAALRENARLELLLGSARHSVGNHLALLSAMLARQARASTDPDIRATFLTATSRVSTIAEVMRSERVDRRERVDAQDLVDRVLRSVSEAAASLDVSIEVEVGAFELSEQEALPFVIILDELVVNSLKHAFPRDIGGVIRIGFGEAAGSLGRELSLTVEDDGVGMTHGVRASRFGGKVISSMVKTLGATLIAEPKSADPNRPGLRTVVTIMRR